MPWDDTELWVAHIETTGSQVVLERPKHVAGGVAESVMQPVWNRHGTLHAISDRSDVWTVYRVDGVDVLTPMLEAHGEVGGPAWLFGYSDYGFTRPDGDLVATWSSDEGVSIGRVSHDGGAQRTWRVPYVSLSSVWIGGNDLVAIAASSDREAEVVRIDLETTEPDTTVLRQPRELLLEPGDISRARVISFPSSEGRVAHALFYAPSNSMFAGPSDEVPPLIVKIHGGPTSAATVGFRLDIQYWTSRGFAVADVDYGGSSGYGRAYRKLLDGRWGIVDVEDCCAAAEYLADSGLVDGDRLAIRGGSAGGFTTLAALAFTDTFDVGANFYGVSDMAAIAQDTHKFESRYLDSLVGPWPEAKQIYAERSPINHVEGFTVPLITFQGLDDEVVPPSQSEGIMKALDVAHVPHTYLAFEGEQHGFRKEATIRSVLDAELSFYGQVFAFDPAGVTEPIVIVHADALDRHRGQRTSGDSET
jgi:dipeptidyl aminopeptidase/acylaminoacyl peptidase